MESPAPKTMVFMLNVGMVANKEEMIIMNKFMNDKVYDILSWIAIIVLPALGAFYASLVGILS